MNRFSSPGRTMEESLDEVLAASDANLATLERKKRAAQGPPITRNQYIEAKRLLAPELYQTTTRSRPASAPRGASLGGSTGRTVAFEDEGNYEQKSEESIDRRFDAFLRKQRLMEDRLKKLESQKNTDSQGLQQLHEENTKLLEEQKHDHRVIHSLKSQLSSLKTRVDLLVSNEEQREAREARSAEHNLHSLRSSQPSPLPLPQTLAPAQALGGVSHSTTHANYTTSVSNAELSAQIAEAVRAHYKTLDHNNPNTNTATNTNTTQLNTSLNTTTIFARSNNETIHSLEKECIRLSAEFDRTKTRLTTLDHAYNELKNTTSIRESRAEEAHKRAVNQYRVEVETFLSSAARKIADALTSIHANTIDINALRTDLDSFIDRTGSVLAEIDTKLTQHDSSIEEIYSVLERVEHSVHNMKHNIQEHDTNILRFVEDSVTIAKLTHTTEQHARTLALHNERIDHINIVCDTNTSAIDAHTVPIDILAKSIDSINDKFESRTDTLHHTIQAHHTNYTSTFDELHTTHKRTRGKVKELAESIKAVSTIRQSIDSVLAEVDNRAKQDATWTYSFKSALQRVEARVLGVERALNPAGALLRGESTDDASIGGEKEPATPSKSTLPLHTTQFDDLRSLITSLRSELTARNDAECSALRGSVESVVEERLRELEDRCQEQMEETRAHCEQYTEDQLQSSLDYVNSTIDTLHTSIADVHTLFDSLSSDVDSLGSSIRAEISGVDNLLQPLREQVLVVENRIDSVCGDVVSVQEQVSSVLDLPERVNILELLCSVDSNNSGDIVTLTTLSAQQATLAQQLHTLHTLHTTTCTSTTSALNMLDNQYSDLAERLEQCNTIIYGQESALNECSDTLQNEVSNMQDSVLDVLNQLSAVRDSSREQIEELSQEMHTLKQDLTAHASFTNDCVADLQTTFEEHKAGLSQQVEQVKVVLQGLDEVQVRLEQRVDGVVDVFNTQLHEVKEEVTQNDAVIHAKLAELSTLHNTEHSTTTTAIAALHTTLAMQDSSAKSRVSAVEKRVAGQEGATRERVVALEVKLSTLEDSLRTHIATMQGTLHSQTLQIQTQSEQLQQSVPLHTMHAQDSQLSTTLTNLITEQCDALKSQLIVLRERVEECEGRVSTTEVELSGAVDSITTQYNTLNTTLHSYIDTAIATTTTTNTSALVTLTNDILSTVDDRNNSMRELVYQLHEIVGTQQDENANTTNTIGTITTTLTALENSIQSTDHLLSEHVNDTTSKYTTLTEIVNSKCSSDEVHALIVPVVLPLVTPLLTQLQDTVTTDYTSAVDVLTNTLHNVENDVVRRCMQTEHALGTLTTTTSTIKAQVADIEEKQREYERSTTHHLDTISTTLATIDTNNANATSTIATLTTQYDTLHTELSTTNTTLTGKISDNTQLLQLYEKRLRTAEKAIETRYSELTKLNSEHHTLLNTLTIHINTVGGSVEQHSADYKTSVNSLTLQLLSIQAQLNDHSDEVRTYIEQELTTLRENVNATLASHSSTSGSTRVEEWISSGSTRLEEWIQTLQSSHEDHLSLFDTTIHAIEQRIGSVEGSVDTIHTTLNTLRDSVDSASSAHNSTLLELHNELQDFTNSSKTRVSSVEQRLIRSEASNKEKLAELDNRIQHNTSTISTIHTTLPALQTQLDDHTNTLATLSSTSDSVHSMQQRMQHIEERIDSYSAEHSDKIGTIEAYIHEQVRAVQGRTVPVTGGASSGVGGERPDEAPHRHTHAPPASTSAPTTAVEADLSHISRVHISPVYRTSSGTTIGDVLDQRVRLTSHSHHDDSVLFAETDILDPHAVDLGYESDLFDEHDNNNDNDSSNIEGRSGDRAEEQEGDDNDDTDNNAESLQQFNSMIETVNFDIATLGVHLKSFQPDQDSSSRRAALQAQLAEDQERQELERQAAVENLQLKKFNHRRKFQRVLFEKQG